MRILVVTLFLSTIAAMHIGWWWWTDRRLRGGTDRPKWVKWLRVGVAVFAVVQIAVIGVLLSGFRPAAPLSMTYLWLLILMPLSIIAIAVKTLVTGTFTLVTIFSREKPREEPADDETWPTRRSVLAAAVAAPPVLTLVGAGIGYSELDDFVISRETLALPNLPPALRGMTIAHVSDTHVGAFTKGRVLTKLVDDVNSLDADLVLFTGDLVNRKVTDVPVAGDMINGMRGKHGTYIVEGNHDLFSGVDAFHRACDKAGLDLIANATRQLTINGHRVDLLGMQWGERGDAGIRRTFAQLPKPRDGAFPILLAHHPHAFDSARQAGIPLTLAGHTHGGQLMLPGDLGFGPIMYKYWSGTYRDPATNAAVVVSNGSGNWFPLRTNAPAEVKLLTLA